MSIRKSPFGLSSRGEAASAYTLELGGISVVMSDYGATLLSIMLPAGRGGSDDILLGFSELGAYEKSDAYFGATVGRYANRIGGARFSLDGATYRLAANNGANHLHGGLVGFDRHVWKASPFEEGSTVGILFELESPDGDEGYPGGLTVKARYALSQEAVLDIGYEARSDAATVIGLTQHAYFNLKGNGRGDILGHELEIAASRYLPVDEGLIPTGELAGVEGGPFDFRKMKPVGRDIGRVGMGYDHCFAIDRASPGAFVEFARLREPESGREMRASTTLPGVQLYTGNYLAGIRGKGNCVYGKHSGLCLETEVYPDSPNKPWAAGSILRPGEVWKHRTSYSFSF
jgi:aldose 1-epimerase